jgi:hypothetical protein
VVDQKILDNLLIQQQQLQQSNILINLLVVLSLFVNDVKVHIAETSRIQDDEIATVVVGDVVAAVDVDVAVVAAAVVVDGAAVKLVIGAHLYHLVVAAVDDLNDYYYYFH